MEDDRGLPGGFSYKDDKLYGYTLKPPILPPFKKQKFLENLKYFSRVRDIYYRWLIY